MIEDISQNILYMNQTMRSIVSEFQTMKEVDLIAVGPTNSASSIESALRAAGKIVSVTHETQPPKSTYQSRGGSDIIAIVGMSGRFPGSDNIEGFWATLQEGRDLHQKVMLLDQDAHEILH